MIIVNKKLERLYNVLKELDVVKNVKEKNIKNQKDWHYLIDLLFDGVYNDKK